MKAIKQIGYGDFRDNLVVVDVPTPNVSPNEILVKVKFASINPHDSKVIQGAFKQTEKLKFPALVGSDFSGVIVKVGKNIDHLVVGDAVFGTVEGALAEYCSVNYKDICLKDSNIDFGTICSFPVVGMTTIQAFDRVGGIHKGDKILIHAGSGGVGTFAIQYAKSKGAFVYTTTSTRNKDWVKTLGADVVIDYKKESYLDVCSELDIVFDTLGDSYSYDAFKIIKNGGKVVSLVPVEINMKIAKELKIPKLIAFFLSLKSGKLKKLIREKNATYEFVFMRPNQAHLAEILSLIKSQHVKPIIEKTFSFSDVISAFEHLAKGRTKGKITIKIDTNE